MRTSIYSILCCVIRLGAVMFLLSTITDTAKLLFSYGRGDFPGVFYLYGIALSLGGLLLAIVLAMYPGPLARLMAGSGSQEVFESPISAAEIQWIAFSILGVFTLMNGIVGLSSWIVDLASIPADWVRGEDDRRQRRLDGFYHASRITLGLALTLGAKGLVSLLQRLRYANSSGAGATRQREPEPDISSNDQV